jgi:cbb3-type cytochrome oxidase maturation protein
MTAGYLLFVLTLTIFGGAAVLALAWAISSGQFDNVSDGANSIFGADEPIGEMTDIVLATDLKPGRHRGESIDS